MRRQKEQEGKAEDGMCRGDSGRVTWAHIIPQSGTARSWVEKNPLDAAVTGHRSHLPTQVAERKVTRMAWKPRFPGSNLDFKTLLAEGL